MPRGRQSRRPVRRVRRTRRRQNRAARQRNRNSRAIATLTRDLYTPRQFAIKNAQVISSPGFIFPIMQPNNWEHIFQNYDGLQNIGVGTQYHMSGVKSKWLIQPENTVVGTVDVHLQVFVVSLKNYQARKFVNNNTVMDEGYHYVSVPLDTVQGVSDGEGCYMINRQIFNVHYNSGMRRLANKTVLGADVTNIQDTFVTGSTYTKHKRLMKSENAGQQFALMTNAEIRDNAQLYLLLFSNASEEAPLFLAHNHVIYGSTTRGI